METREVDLEFVAKLNLAWKERLLLSAYEAENAQKSFLLSKFPRDLKCHGKNLTNVLSSVSGCECVG